MIVGNSAGILVGGAGDDLLVSLAPRVLRLLAEPVTTNNLAAGAGSTTINAGAGDDSLVIAGGISDSTLQAVRK